MKSDGSLKIKVCLTLRLSWRRWRGLSKVTKEYFLKLAEKGIAFPDWAKNTDMWPPRDQLKEWRIKLDLVGKGDNGGCHSRPLSTDGVCDPYLRLDAQLNANLLGHVHLSYSRGAHACYQITLRELAAVNKELKHIVKRIRCRYTARLRSMLILGLITPTDHGLLYQWLHLGPWGRAGFQSWKDISATYTGTPLPTLRSRVSRLANRFSRHYPLDAECELDQMLERVRCAFGQSTQLGATRILLAHTP